MTDPMDHAETLGGSDRPSEVSEPRQPPRLLAERYRLERLVATGGMAAVWKGHDAVLARSVAIKILHDHLAEDLGFRERFRREAVAAANLTHPNVVGVYDTGASGDHVYLVMEFVEGVTLADIIAEAGRLEPGRAAVIGTQIARALAYAHSNGFVHRDVKPANILVDGEGTAKIADFGIAKVEEAGDDLTKTGTVLGTAAYVAPEQVAGETLTGAADQYALGCVLYEALAGEQPFQANSPVATAAQRLDSDPPPLRWACPDAASSLITAIERAMARSPSERFPSISAFADALAAHAHDPNSPLALPTAPAPDVRRARSRPEGRTTGLAGAAPSDRRKPGPAPVARQRAQPAQPAQRHRRPRSQRRLAPLAMMLVAALLAGGLLVGQLEGVFDGDGQPGGAPVEGEPAPLELVDITLFDPSGGGSEQANAGELANLLDGDDTTEWSSVGYNTPAFGNLKSGLGFWVDLGQQHELEQVTLGTSTPGVALQLRAADSPGAQPDDWQTIASVDETTPQTVVTFDDAVESQYLLVWVTGNLQPDGGRYRVGFSSLTVEGEPV